MTKPSISFPAFFLAFYAVWVLRATVFYSAVDLSISNAATRLLLANVIKIFLWLVPAVVYIISVNKQDPLQVMRITTKVDWKGVLSSFVVTVFYFVGVFTFEYFVFRLTLLPLLRSMISGILMSFLAVPVSAITEELMFRGFVLSALQAGHKFWIANVLQSFLFTAMHWSLWIWVSGLNSGLVITSSSIFILAILLGWITQRTNSIWPAILVHIANNFLVSFLG